MLEQEVCGSRVGSIKISPKYTVLSFFALCIYLPTRCSTGFKKYNKDMDFFLLVTTHAAQESFLITKATKMFHTLLKIKLCLITN